MCFLAGEEGMLRRERLMGAEKVRWSGVDIQSLQAVIFQSAKNE